MRSLLIFALGMWGISASWVQAQAPIQITIEAETFPGFPALQSYAVGVYAGKWVLLAGRTDGLHRRQPFAAFAPAGANGAIYVVDPVAKTVQAAPLDGLPTALREQLLATNLEFTQHNETLYLVGGYGYSASQGSFLTYPYLTAVDLPGLIQAVSNGSDLAPAFRQLTDERLRVTGGYLHRLDGYFYLVGGQLFQGAYNPMGPTHGPGFFQAYTNAIKRFQIVNDTQTGLAIADYTEVTDSLLLHRRDYNLLPQIFSDGSRGFTAFSGVFRYDADLPWLNIVDINSDGSYAPHPSFQQFLNQYHTAHATLYTQSEQTMYNLFFGGISQYFLDGQGLLVEDANVPFVRTISLVTRQPDGALTEYQVGEMPAWLGASAEFLPAAALPQDEQGILALDALPQQRTLLGYVLGGIQSTQPNVLFQDNNGSLSSATGQVWRVYLEPTAPSAIEVSAASYFAPELYPNPSSGDVTLNFLLPKSDSVTVRLLSPNGQTLATTSWDLGPGEYEWDYSGQHLPAGVYHIHLGGRHFALALPWVVE